MAKAAAALKPNVTFIDQAAPVGEYGRALYAVGRSIVRALLDSLSTEDLTDLNTELNGVTMRQLSKVARLDRDKGMRGDGFEWAVHEAIVGQEPRVRDPVSEAIYRASRNVERDVVPTSLMFGQERAKYLGFVGSTVSDAGETARLIPGYRGRPFNFGPSVSLAAQGHLAEPDLPARVKKLWKTDLFLSGTETDRWFAATVKSNASALEGGRGLRIGIVPEHANASPAGVRYDGAKDLWVVSLEDPDGFMGLFNDTYRAVGRAVCRMGKHELPPYYTAPSAKGVAFQEQLEKYPDVAVVEIEGALNEAAQQELIVTTERLVGVNPPHWLHMKELAPKIIAPKPKFMKLD